MREIALTSQLKYDREVANMADDTSRTMEQEGVPSTESTGYPTNRMGIVDNGVDNQVDIVDDDEEVQSDQLPSTINQQSSNEEDVRMLGSHVNRDIFPTSKLLQITTMISNFNIFKSRRLAIQQELRSFQLRTNTLHTRQQGRTMRNMTRQRK